MKRNKTIETSLPPYALRNILMTTEGITAFTRIK